MSNETVRYAKPPFDLNLWDAAWSFLAPAAARAGEGATEELVRELCDTAHAQLWLVRRDGELVAAAVTERAGDTLHFWLCGGNGCDWADCMRQVMALAEMSGIRYWTAEGRRGWERVLRHV